MKSQLTILFFILIRFSFCQSPTLSVGQSAPLLEHRMEASSSEYFSLMDLKGEGLIVVFTSNTCPFVVGFNDGSFNGWENTYNSIAEKASQSNINTVLINSNEAKRGDGESMADMIKRKSDKRYSMPYLIDNNSELANAFGAKTTPHVFFFDRNMKLIYTGSIDNSFDDDKKSEISYLMNAIEAYSNDKKIKTKSTSPKGCSIKRVKN
ncbi:MAG: redoxin domain-containing protein [Bacteroidetes bacterium]|nr:redoxin domain-containing protein [Bacteroidota bacterium]